MAGIQYDEIAVMDEMKTGGDEAVAGDLQGVGAGVTQLERSPHSLTKTRSLSDGGGVQLSPSPFIIDTRRTSKDDSELRDSSAAPNTSAAPVTPRRPDFGSTIRSGLSLQITSRDSSSTTTPGQGQAQAATYVKPSPLSPKLDQSHSYASPTNILPRRSRGLDFSRAATSLHHSTLAEQSSPDASPTTGGRAMNIPARSFGQYGTEQSSNSLWSVMGNQERMNISSSVGSANHMILGSDSSSSSDDDDLMDEEMEDAFMGTPQATKSGQVAGVPWMPGNSPAANSLNSFRTRPRKLQTRRKLRGPLGLGFNPAAPPPGISKSPPNNVVNEMRDSPGAHARRESISWAANQLHISAVDDERAMDSADIPRDNRGGVIKRVVTRRGNLLVWLWLPHQLVLEVSVR
ncbi:hypothetical protein BKA67DRAFT_577849 [Truncatella angustata]|uniref:Uncharacterized protein n=1 Tax=Truncatella angustata TaxID=152316 RepID=A0A9P8RK65_9PEZI|nr:uncharacterized protein BKA67DRAFT_577849 [Truncatella angustata]KAH6647555.1 hypothetical protein BKA67DRAFT_577849 [Truncatella angustata]